MEKLLFFGLTDTEFQKIKPVASRLKLHCEQIPVSMYHNTLGAIASGRAVPAGIPAAPGTPVPRQPHGCFRRRCPCRCLRRFRCLRHTRSRQHSGSRLRDRLLVMCQLPERRMDKLLFELRRIDAPIDYKAVLTPTNAGWTIPRLLMEMHSEKAAYTAKKPLKGLSQ